METDRTVTLNWYEVELASTVGVRREADAMRRGCEPRNGGSENGSVESVGKHIDGAGAELAVAKFLHKYWIPAVGEFKHCADIWPNIEVRSTPHANGHLFIYQDADANSPYVLVRGTMPTYEIVGWIRARDGMRSEWLRPSPRGGEDVYWIPAEVLRTDFNGKKD